MSEIYSRTEKLLGEEALSKLAGSRVAVFGVGGVGGYVVEALARSGVGALDLIDNDVVAESNINRQIIALHSTLGQLKVDVAAARVKDINPSIQVHTYPMFFLPDTASTIPFEKFDYVVDAIDTVTGKIALIEYAKKAGCPVISSMGAGNKLNPTMFKVADIHKTSVCPLAKVMRRELGKRGIKNVKVVYSEEPPITYDKPSSDTQNRNDNTNPSPELEQIAKPARVKQTPGSIAFVPSVVGLIIASEVIKDLI